MKWFASKTCRDSKGNHGNCTSLQSCYADIRFPQLSGWSEFISGDYDSCAYITSLGVPFVGACCTKHIQGGVISSTARAPPAFDQIPHWPPTPPALAPVLITHPTHPPLPTHPPGGLTHPPLPTHAPLPSAPGFVLPWLTKPPVRRPRPTQVTIRRPRPTPPVFITLPWLVPKQTTTASTSQPIAPPVAPDSHSSTYLPLSLRNVLIK